MPCVTWVFGACTTISEIEPANAGSRVDLWDRHPRPRRAPHVGLDLGDPDRASQSGHGSLTTPDHVNVTERRSETWSRIARSVSLVRAPNGYAYVVTS